MKDIVSIFSFGQTIAYLIPGFIGAYALSRLSTFLNKLMALTFNNTFRIEGSIILLFMSMAIGLIISAIRVIIVDKLTRKSLKIDYQFNYSRLLNQDVRATYDYVIQNSWRFAQFYGNMMIATLILFVFNVPIYAAHLEYYWLLALVFFFTICVLFLAYQKQFKTTLSITATILRTSKAKDMR